ncbi:hypothetical protein Bca4012_052265 [Brassica carinata]
MRISRQTSRSFPFSRQISEPEYSYHKDLSNYFPSSRNLSLKKHRPFPIGTLSSAELKHQLRNTSAFPQSKG